MTTQQKPTEALVTSALIVWARKRRSMSAEQAADKLKVKPEIFEAWEKGEKRPTVRQAKDLAHIFSIPFGYLYLSTPPEERPAIPDLRTVSGAGGQPFSPEFIDTYHDVLRKQAWYKQELLSHGAARVPYVSRFSAETPPRIVAADLREALELNDAMRRQANPWDAFLRTLIGQAEKIGILVMRTGMVHNNTHRTLDVQEFRGFAISDEYAPVVFINGRDAKSAQIFTFAHELAHLWYGDSGISNPTYLQRTANNVNTKEQVSDAVAAELLVPESTFRRTWNGGSDLEEHVDRLAEVFKVSSVVILRRALTFGLIDHQQFLALYDNVANRRPKKAKGGDYFANVVAGASQTIARALITAVSEGRTSHYEAARLLNVSVTSLSGVAESVFGEATI